jgi:hypothetical protein
MDQAQQVANCAVRLNRVTQRQVGPVAVMILPSDLFSLDEALRVQVPSFVIRLALPVT